MTDIIKLFDSLAKEKETFLSIKSRVTEAEKSASGFLFYYHLYNAIHEFYSKEITKGEHTRSALKYFIAKEENLSNSIAVINNTYQMAIMLDRQTLLSILTGRANKILVLGSDASKLGALLAMNYLVYAVEKGDLLSEILFLS